MPFDFGDLGACATIEEWRDAVKEAGLWNDMKNWRDKWSRAKNALMGADLIEVVGEMVSLHP